MKTSSERILTTHVGSMPRPQYVVDQLFAQDQGQAYDEVVFDGVMQRAVREVAAKTGRSRRRCHQRWRDEQDQLRHVYPAPVYRLRN